MFDSYPDVVTVKELCRMLQIGKNTAYGLLNTCIPSIRIGRKRLIPKSYVIKYVDNLLFPIINVIIREHQ